MDTSFDLLVCPKKPWHLILNELSHWVRTAYRWGQAGLQHPMCNGQPDQGAFFLGVHYLKHLAAASHTTLGYAIYLKARGEIDFVNYVIFDKEQKINHMPHSTRRKC